VVAPGACALASPVELAHPKPHGGKAECDHRLEQGVAVPLDLDGELLVVVDELREFVVGRTVYSHGLGDDAAITVAVDRVERARLGDEDRPMA